MKLLIFCVLVITQVLLNCAEDNSSYTAKYDSFDIKEVMKNERLLTSYVHCLLDEGPCTAEGKELKKNLPDAAENECKKCTRKQKENADLMIKYMVDNRPDDWAKLDLKYNANDTYVAKYIFEDVNDMNQTNLEVSEY